METENDKHIKEMAKESYLMRREIAIFAVIFLVIAVTMSLYVFGSLTTVVLPY